jgi:hypothetical protein
MNEQLVKDLAMEVEQIKHDPTTPTEYYVSRLMLLFELTNKRE